MWLMISDWSLWAVRKCFDWAWQFGGRQIWPIQQRSLSHYGSCGDHQSDLHTCCIAIDRICHILDVCGLLCDCRRSAPSQNPPKLVLVVKHLPSRHCRLGTDIFGNRIGFAGFQSPGHNPFHFSVLHLRLQCWLHNSNDFERRASRIAKTKDLGNKGS